MKRGHQQIQRKLGLPGGAGRRQSWRNLAEQALIQAHVASGRSSQPANHGPMRPLTPLEQIRALRRDCRAADMPVEGVSAALVGEAFLKVVDAFAAEATPSERRSRWADLLRTAAEAMLGLLEDANRAEASVVAHRWMDRD